MKLQTYDISADTDPPVHTEATAFSTLAMRALYGAQVSWVCSGPTMLVFFKGGSDQAIALNNFAGRNRVPTCIFSEL